MNPVGYQTDALFGDQAQSGQIPPNLMNSGAQTFQDVLLNGLAASAVNGVNVALGTQPTAGQQLQAQVAVSQGNQMMTAVLICAAVYFLVKI